MERSASEPEEVSTTTSVGPSQRLPQGTHVTHVSYLPVTVTVETVSVPPCPRPDPTTDGCQGVAEEGQKKDLESRTWWDKPPSAHSPVQADGGRVS